MIYDLVLLAHVAAGLIGYGSIAFSGYFASALAKEDRARSLDAGSAKALARAVHFFEQGPGLAPRVIYLVPVLGGVLLWLGGGLSEASEPWVITGGLAWLASVGVAHGLLWPAEEALAGMLAGGSWNNVDIKRVACRVELGSTVTMAFYSVGLVAMIAQPGR